MASEASGACCSTAIWPALPADAGACAPGSSNTATRRPARDAASAQARPTMPPPITTSSAPDLMRARMPSRTDRRARSSVDSAVIQARPRMAGRMRPGCPRGVPAGLEAAADHALLHPGRAGREVAVGGQAGQLGAGAGAAGRAVVGLAGAQHEVARVGAGRRREQLDVVDLRAVRPGDALGHERAADAPRERRSAPPRAPAPSAPRTTASVDRKNQLPPHATSPVTGPTPGTSSVTPAAGDSSGTLKTVTRPSACSSCSTGPTGVSSRCRPGPMRPRCASVATTPIVPWPHMPSMPTLLKKIMPATQPGARGSTAARRPWCRCRAARRRRRSGRRRGGARSRRAARPACRRAARAPPATTPRVGSPAVWESMTRMDRQTGLPRGVGGLISTGIVPVMGFPCMGASRVVSGLQMRLLAGRIPDDERPVLAETPMRAAHSASLRTRAQ